MSWAVALRAVGVAVVAVLAAGCTVTPTTPASAPFTPPAWFAQQAQQQEEYRSGLQGCLTGKGWQVTVDLAGGIAEALTADELERVTADIALCRQSMGYPVGDPPPQTAEQLDAQFTKLLDVRACLVAQGVPMAPAPSRGAWVDQSLADQAAAAQGVAPKTQAWHPYSDPELLSLPAAKQQELWATCPQPWATSW